MRSKLFFVNLNFALFLILFAGSETTAQSDSTVNYFPNGNIESIVRYYNGLREGPAILYSENGNIKQELTYLNGKVEGPVKTYYDNGNLYEFYTIENGKRQGPTSYFDSAGVYVDDRYFVYGKLKDVIDKEESPALPPDEKKEPIAVQADNNIITEAKPVEPKKTQQKKNDEAVFFPPIEEEREDLETDPAFYLTAEIMPEPLRGWKSLYEKIVYPDLAREKKVEGVVKLRTFINRNGDVERTEIIESLPFGCTDAAEIAVQYTRFKPGLIRGKKVNVQMVIEIEFKP